MSHPGREHTAGKLSTVLLRTDDGVDIAVYEWGPGSGSPILLAHPTGFCGQIWEPTAEILAANGHRVVSFDFRGHGDSSADPDGTYTWERFALDALAVASWIDDPRLVGAGHSKGAASLLIGAAESPHIYARIWAFEPIVFPSEVRAKPDHDFPLAVGARKRRNEWASPDEAFEVYSTRGPLSVMDHRCLRAYVNNALRDRGDGVYELKCAPETEAMVYTMGPVNGAWSRLGDIRIPVTLLCGGNSTDMGPRMIALLAERLPNCTTTIWEGHGHFGPQADPERTAESILDAART